MNAKYLQPRSVIYFLLFIFLLMVIYLLTFNTYDYYQASVIVSCDEKCSITGTIIIDNSSPNIDFVILDNQKYLPQQITFSEPTYSSEYASLLQDVQIQIDVPKSANNQVKKVTILANKQRIYRKIWQKFQ